MKSARRMTAAVVLAVFVASGLAVVTPASAATEPQAGVTATHVTLDEICGKLSDYIAFLEARPPSRLRDFLLAQARNLFSRYCQ